MTVRTGRDRTAHHQRPIVLVAGTFDCLHAGHHDFFRQAHILGHVTAIVARDRSVKNMKQRLPHERERTRVARVARAQHIARARLGHPTDFLQPLFEERPDIIALGYDQTTFRMNKLRQLLAAKKLYPKIIRLKSYRPHIFKSSILKKRHYPKTPKHSS